MKVPLILPIIHPNRDANGTFRNRRGFLRGIGQDGNLWVARIVGMHGDGRLKREFVQSAATDCSCANPDGKGRFALFLLSDGCYYEASAMKNSHQPERFFVMTDTDRAIRVSGLEVIKWARRQ